MKLENLIARKKRHELHPEGIEGWMVNLTNHPMSISGEETCIHFPIRKGRHVYVIMDQSSAFACDVLGT